MAINKIPHTHTHMNTHTYTNEHTQRQTKTHKHTHTHRNTSTHVLKQKQHTHTHTEAYQHTYTHTLYHHFSGSSANISEAAALLRLAELRVNQGLAGRSNPTQSVNRLILIREPNAAIKPQRPVYTGAGPESWPPIGQDGC